MRRIFKLFIFAVLCSKVLASCKEETITISEHFDKMESNEVDMLMFKYKIKDTLYEPIEGKATIFYEKELKNKQFVIIDPDIIDIKKKDSSYFVIIRSGIDPYYICRLKLNKRSDDFLNQTSYDVGDTNSAFIVHLDSVYKLDFNLLYSQTGEYSFETELENNKNVYCNGTILDYLIFNND